MIIVMSGSTNRFISFADFDTYCIFILSLYWLWSNTQILGCFYKSGLIYFLRLMWNYHHLNYWTLCCLFWCMIILLPITIDCTKSCSLGILSWLPLLVSWIMKRLEERMLVVKCWVSSIRLVFGWRFADFNSRLTGFDGRCASSLAISFIDITGSFSIMHIFLFAKTIWST